MEMDLFINMRQFLAILWTFVLFIHFNQLFSSNLQSGDNLCTNHKQNYLSENVLCSGKIVRDIFEKPGKKKKIEVSLAVQ